jgi:hypothetical protein
VIEEGSANFAVILAGGVETSVLRMGEAGREPKSPKTDGLAAAGVGVRGLAGAAFGGTKLADTDGWKVLETGGLAGGAIEKIKSVDTDG